MLPIGERIKTPFCYALSTDRWTFDGIDNDSDGPKVTTPLDSEPDLANRIKHRHVDI
jgi:hypothetical protein